MLKYFVIYVPGTGEFLKAMAKQTFDTTPSIAEAGKWPDEESAYNWASSDSFLGVYFMIQPVFVRR